MQTLSSRYEEERDLYEIDWTVDARKIRSNDRQAVSPPFHLPLAGIGEQPTPFRLMLRALSEGHRGGRTSFKTSSGRGVVLLKCEGDLPERAADVAFRISVGGGPASPARGPLVHDFARRAVGGLPEQAEWQLDLAVDEPSLTLPVHVEAAPCAPGASPTWVCVPEGETRFQ